LWYIDKFNNNFFKNKNFTKRQGLNKWLEKALYWPEEKGLD
jgi:hypothetical protein